MSSLLVKKGLLHSKVDVPSSKSYANRALILAAIKSQTQTLSRLPQSTDVTILIDCLKKLGLDIETSQDSLTIKNSFPLCEKGDLVLEVGEGGTTARFLAGMLLLGSAEYTLILGERLRERPWNEFLDFVHAHGGIANLKHERLTLKGPLKLPKSVQVDCSKTTQFATAIQLAFSGTGTKVIPENLASSQSYWNMTEKLIDELNRSDSYTIPLDWSSASYPLAFGALNQEIVLSGLKYDPFQADAKFFDILKEFDAIHVDGYGMTVGPIKKHFSLKFDVSDALDLVPTLGYFLAHVEGTHELTGIGNLIHKESDRLDEVIKLLGLFEKKAWKKNDSLFIEGSDQKIHRKIDLKLPNDHRMVMAGTLFLLQHQGGSIGPVDAVSKSYPEFFKLLQKTSV